jgi:initiation factor 1A
VFREDGQGLLLLGCCVEVKLDALVRIEKEYAQVIKMLGNGRLEAQCFDGEKRLAHIRGQMRKKVRLRSSELARC